MSCDSRVEYLINELVEKLNRVLKLESLINAQYWFDTATEYRNKYQAALTLVDKLEKDIKRLQPREVFNNGSML